MRRIDRLADRTRTRLAAAAFAWTLGGPITVAHALGKPTPTPTKTAIEAVVVDAHDVDQAALIDALALRAPNRRLHPAASAPDAPSELWAYAQIRATDPSVLRVALILSDGRAYYRDVEASTEVAPRSVASAIANLLAGIEGDRVAPDAEDVPMPEPEPKPEPEAKPEPEPKTEPKTPAEPARPPTVDVGVAVTPLVVLGLGRPPPTGLAGGGAAVGVDVRFDSGGALAFEVRPLGRARDGWGLARVRLAGGGGYIWRRGAFELVTTAALTLEPWLVVRGGSRQSISTGTGDDATTTELVGAMLRIVPAWRRNLGRLVLRLGPRLDLAGSGVPGDNGGVARIRTPGSGGALNDLFRVGGLELGVGIDVAIWIPVQR